MNLRLTACLLTLLLALAGLAQDSQITAVEPSQLGVYRVVCPGALSPGDILQVTRGEQKLGEATVMKVTPDGAVISLRGVYEVRLGDQVSFLRRPAAPAVAGPPTPSHEYRLAERQLPMVWRAFPESADAQGKARLEAIGSKLARGSGRNIPWHFYLVEAEHPNAFTIGEGFVFVTDSLLAIGLTDDELAGVLAHEICHGTERHTLRGQDQKRQSELALKELEEAERLAERYRQEYAEDGNRASYESKMVTAHRRLDAARARLKSVSYQQEHEREYNHADEIDADLKGLELAVRAGFDPDGLDRALSKLQQEGVRLFGDAALQGGQTHPPVARRLEVLRRVRASWQRR